MKRSSTHPVHSLEAEAFAPGHVTGIFAPRLHARDPRARGSIGAGLVLELGAHARIQFQPGSGDSVQVRAESPGPWPVTEEVLLHLRPATRGTLTVTLRHDLPVGQGFGMSAAGALATALAIADLFQLSRQRAIEVAHLADLFGGGGLGGVAAILGGGFEIRRSAGIPPRGSIDRHPFHRSLFVGIAGRPIPSPPLLTDPRFLAEVDQAAHSGLAALARSPRATTFLTESEKFTDELALAGPSLLRLLNAIRDTGGWAAQAMFGRAFFAVARDAAGRRAIARLLERRGIRAVELGTSPEGARSLPGPAPMLRR